MKPEKIEPSSDVTPGRLLESASAVSKAREFSQTFREVREEYLIERANRLVSGESLLLGDNVRRPTDPQPGKGRG